MPKRTIRNNFSLNSFLSGAQRPKPMRQILGARHIVDIVSRPTSTRLTTPHQDPHHPHGGKLLRLSRNHTLFVCLAHASFLSFTHISSAFCLSFLFALLFLVFSLLLAHIPALLPGPPSGQSMWLTGDRVRQAAQGGEMWKCGIFRNKYYKYLM